MPRVVTVELAEEEERDFAMLFATGKWKTESDLLHDMAVNGLGCLVAMHEDEEADKFQGPERPVYTDPDKEPDPF